MFRLMCIVFWFHVGFAFIDIKDNMISFSHAKKQAKCSVGEEVLLFEHNTGPGVITEQWFAGTSCFSNKTRIRYYIDGDETATFDVNLYMLHGIGFLYVTDIPTGPWGTKRIGLTATGGGLYNTIGIPFQKSIRITFISVTPGLWWSIVRGVENYPVVVGDLKLPANARLVLHQYEQFELEPLTYVTLAHSVNKSGLLFMVTLAGESADFNYLEGCFRLKIGDTGPIQYLSSGTEDFFLSAYYFNKGLFHTDHSGLTYIRAPGTMSAYKFFEADPILFFNQSFHLIWRVGEINDNNCYNGGPEKCVVNNGKVVCWNEKEKDYNTVKLANTRITSYVWLYEW